MHVTPYLFFPGNCEEAVRFYAETLDTDPPDIIRMKDMPPEDQAAMEGMPEDAVMNVMLKKGDFEIMASDATPEDAGKMAGVSIHLALDSVAEAQRVFDVFADGGSIGMPLQKTFWAEAFGTVADRYGVRWMVSAA